MAFTQIRVTLTLEIEGQDITQYLVPGQPLQVKKSTDFPQFGVYRSAGLEIQLDNNRGRFDISGSFWSDNSLPPSGSGAKALLTVTRDGDTWQFAGRIVSISQTLKTKITTCVIRDLSLLMRFGVNPSLGQELTRRITDYAGAAADYAEGQYWFRLPLGLYPVKAGTLSAKIIDGDTETEVTIVDEIKNSGTLSGTTAAVDTENGILKFEAAPAAAEATVIDATWKINFRYNRADRLLFELLKGSGVVGVQGLTDAQARFGIEPAIIENDTPVFSSHGRPYFQEEGIARWLKYNPLTNKWLLAIDNRLVEYDEYQDEYSEVSSTPADTTIDEQPPGGYGARLNNEHIAFNSTYTFYIHNNQIYASGSAGSSNSNGVSTYNLDGVRITSNAIRHPGRAPNDGITIQGRLQSQAILDIKILNNDMFMLYSYTIGHSGTSAIAIIDLSPNPRPTRFIPARTILDNFGQVFGIHRIAVTLNRIILVDANENVRFIDHNGTAYPNEGFALPNNPAAVRGIEATANFIYTLGPNLPASGGQPAIDNDIRVFTYGGVEVTNRRFVVQSHRNSNTRATVVQVIGNKLYTYLSDFGGISVFSIVADLNYHNFTPYQFDFNDSRYIYVLATNTITGDVLFDTTFNRVRIYKYDRNQDAWTTLLDPDKGQPQLAMPYDFVTENRRLADNRKNFKVIQRNNKTLIFYRRVQVGSASIAIYNETDDVITNVYTETFSGDNRGLPYSMDFWVDERATSLHVYAFVVNYTFSGAVFSSATLKVYRRQVQPLGTQIEIFTETFTSTSGDDLYPVSVSDVILADDRSKWYFTLDYQSEGDIAGKAELCELPKDGGTRVVRKTYTNPLLGPRSPARIGNRYFYLEGGWVRLPKSDPADDTIPDDERHYPNEGGHLIEIESNGDITDHGIAWQGATKADSPNPDSEIYDGYGLFNTMMSNMVSVDGNLRFAAGYGSPFLTTNNLPRQSIEAPIYYLSNFHLLQWGDTLASKIPEFKTAGKNYWGLAQELAQLLGWELGFGPAAEVVSAFKTAHSGVSDWSANSLVYLRPPSVRKGTLRTAIAASGAASIAIDDVEVSDFPAGLCIIDKELFRYTGRTADTDGITLSGVTRAQEGSTAAAHSAGALVYFVASLILDTDASLLDIDQKYLDIANLYNNIRINYAGGTVQKSDAASTDMHGEFTLSIDAELLTAENAAWRDYLLNLYLPRYKSERELLKARVPIDVNLDLGELVVVKAGGGVNVDFKKYALVRQSQDLRRFQTELILREVD